MLKINKLGTERKNGGNVAKHSRLVCAIANGRYTIQLKIDAEKIYQQLNCVYVLLHFKPRHEQSPVVFMPLILPLPIDSKKMGKLDGYLV